MVKRLLVPTVAILAVLPGCSEQTLTGTITDAWCTTGHWWDEHSEPETDQACTIKCVRGGSQYVLLTRETVYTIENQDHPDLEVYAGQSVELTGRLEEDRVTVSRIGVPGS